MEVQNLEENSVAFEEDSEIIQSDQNNNSPTPIKAHELTAMSPYSGIPDPLDQEEEKSHENRHNSSRSRGHQEKAFGGSLDIYNLRKKDLSNSKVIIECSDLCKGRPSSIDPDLKRQIPLYQIRIQLERS